MQAAEVKTVDLKTLIPRNIRNRRDLGGMSLSHTGELMEMWGQLRLLKVGNGDGVDVTFINVTDKRSAVRNAVWSMPEHGSAVIAIGNAGTAQVKAMLQFSDGDNREVVVPPLGTELIRRRSEPPNRRSADAVKVTSADGAGNLIVAGAVTSNDGKFTSSIRFYDTENVAQQNLYATNVRLHRVNGQLVLYNSGTTDISAIPRFRPVTGDPNDFIDFASVNLRPNEIQTIDLTSLSRGTQGRKDFDRVSIEVINSGTKGSLIGALNGVDEKNGLTYDVPLRDSGGPRNSTGAYPWRLDGDVSTIVSITNASPGASQFVVQINYPGGPYLLDPQKLPAGDTATFDLRQIRDKQIPDRNGHTIPRSVEGGQFRWFVHLGGHLIGRAEMLSVSRGISSSYSCGTPCPPRYDHGYTDPETAMLDALESRPQAVLEIDVDSYDNEYGPYAASVVSATTYNTDIATFDGSSVYGVDSGETTTAATVEYALYILEPGMDCYPYGTNQAGVYGAVHVNASVYISGMTLTVNPVAHTNGESFLRVEIAASTEVPAGTQVLVEAFIQNNPSGVSMDLTPSNGHGTVTISGGTPATAEFTVKSDSQNSHSGTVTYKARILSVTSGDGLVTVTAGTATLDTVALTVN